MGRGVDCVGVGVVRSWEGTGTVAVLVTKTSWQRDFPRAGFLEDVHVESSEKVADFCPKLVRGMAPSSLSIDASS